jgi:predicted negative regulator of RcsB-dependent stress response
MDQKAPDKSRLRQVQTTDLTESRLNDDFVYWLKKNGSNYLLVVLLVACGILGWNYYQRQQVMKSAVAWSDLATASDSRMPEPLEQVAKDHASVPQVAIMALISAGDLRLGQIQRSELSPAVGTTPAVPLDAAARKIAQEAADDNYAKAAQLASQFAAGNDANVAPILFSSLFGRAAVAESRGDFEASKKFLDQAATIAGERWPRIAEVAKSRVAGLVALATPVAVPLAAEIPVKTTAPAPTPAASDDVFNTILQEQQTGSGGAPAPAPVTPPPAPAPAPTPAPSSGGR